jgi:threonine dehydrogenase-like Zn-dependent dehydrogenase
VKAVVLREGELVVDEIAEPPMGADQIRVRTLACGICGTDLHIKSHGDQLNALHESMGIPAVDFSRDVVMGHELCAEVLEVGPDAEGPEPGTVVTSVPYVYDEHRTRFLLGQNNTYPGGYAEQMVFSPENLLLVPPGIDPVRAAVAEPMAVGIHAVKRSEIDAERAAVVMGCGPIGLGVIAGLRLRGVELIIAADLSAARRQLALTMGAQHAVDPRQTPPVEVWRDTGDERPLVMFEVTGARGLIQQCIATAPRGARIVVVGVCPEEDAIMPMMAIPKELEIRFAAGYGLEGLQTSLDAIARDAIDVTPMITKVVGYDGVGQAFEDLAQPDLHCKIVIRP